VFGFVDGVVRSCWGDEIGWDDFGTLVDELVEGMLAVGACGSPDNGLEFSN
jgi:hypothetical protein